MGLNNDGYSGVDIEQIALEKRVIVGTQAPNTFPCIKVQQNGKSLPKMDISENIGTDFSDSSGYDCSYIDTSWLAHGGIYSLAVGNKINIQCGAGGFEWITSGPSRLCTPYQDFLCTYCFNINTRLFKVASTERTHLMGTRLDIQYDEIYIMGNTNFTNNVHINGGLFVNGEIYCSHITTQEQTNHTVPCGTSKGFINPGQSFVMFNGASLAAEKIVQSALPWKALAELPDSPAYVDCYIALMLPAPFDALWNVPCKIAFPKGVSFMSDAMAMLEPKAEEIIANGGNRVPGCGINKGDLLTPGHTHSFNGPACQYIKDTGNVYKEAKDAIQSETPAPSKQMFPDGCTSLEQVPQMLIQATQNSVIEFMKQLWDDINPFKDVTWI